MPTSPTGNVVFREVQQFRQIWLWAMVLAWPGIMTAILGYGLVRRLVFGYCMDQSAAWSTEALIVGFVVPLLVSLALSWLLYAMKLITEVRADGLHVRFWPLPWRRIGFEEITEYWPRTYRPIREYGGWGIRWGLGGKAYNVSGNQGVQLVLDRGRRLLIGSRRAEELAAAVGDARAARAGREPH
ncbi:MAG: hypothetical protein GX616_25200 [Planctomycetes bacterium]|nr:hypothetical protein [Planctomycetota bacterium]